MHTLQNNKLKISVKNTGAELCEITSLKNGLEFMWNANPEIWGSYAPNLFPIIGALKDNCYFLENKKYTLPKHGFIRNNEAVVLHYSTSDCLIFKLLYNKESLKNYPFKFEFYITYRLSKNTITVEHKIKNIDNKIMYFSVGGHPAFKCPVFDDEQYNDYILEFEHLENSKTHLINMNNGLISPNTKPLLNKTNKLPLTHDLFNEDALIFKDLVSKKVSLTSKKHGNILSVSFSDFPYLGIWAKPTGNYVCIEPWLGIADNENTNQDFKSKEGIRQLEPKATFKASYKIEINNNLL